MMNISFFVFVALLFPLADLWLYPRLQRETAAGTPGARVRYHLLGAASLWLLAGIALALAVRRHLPWSEFRLGAPSSLRLVLGFTLVVAYLALALRQRRQLLARPERLQRFIRKFATGEALLPHTAAELRSFNFLSLTAGVCEEIIYRGFMLWFATVWLGLWPGLVVSSLAFGAGHLYLGWKHAVKTAIFGSFIALLVVASASLWPAMLLHAFVDLIGGDLGYRAFSGLEPLEQVRHERLGEAIGNGADGAALLVE